MWTPSMQEEVDAADIPVEILLLIDTTHVFKLKLHTYYNHNMYESYTTTRVIDPPRPAEVVHPTNQSDQLEGNGEVIDDRTSTIETNVAAEPLQEGNDNEIVQQPPILPLHDSDETPNSGDNHENAISRHGEEAPPEAEGHGIL